MAPRLTRIYTRTGDQGMTALAGGRRVSKASLAVESYGEVDELVSQVGLLRALARGHAAVAAESERLLRTIQADLFALGLVLATPVDHRAYADRVAQFRQGCRARGGPRPVRFLEQHIDRYNRALPSLPGFVLPGSGVLSAQAQVARTVCRRLERVLVRRAAAEPVDPAVLAYANRLSDYLFVYARWVAWRLGEAESLWAPSGPAAARGRQRPAGRQR
jgi:cob(I)alamin adenosyltransferase